MREGTRNFMVGITSMFALLGLAALLMSFGELDPLLNPRYRLLIMTDNATGVRPGANVEFNGVPVGIVNSVQTQADPHYPVRIDCRIDAKVQIPTDAVPFAATQLIGGSAILQLQAPANGHAAQGTFLPTDDTAAIAAPLRGGLLAELTDQLDRRLAPLLDSLERFNRLSDTYSKLGDSLNEMVAPQDPADVAAGADPNLRTAVRKFNSALDTAQEGLELARSFLGDESMRADARGAVHKANALIDQATTAVDRYTKLADSLQSSSEQLTKRVLPLADALAATLEDVRRLSRLAIDGRGTVGQLINNPDLYNSLNDAASRLDRTLIDLQLLIEKFRAEGVPIQF